MDISDHRSKHLDEFYGSSFDYIITVCDRVREECLFSDGPTVFIGVHQTRWKQAAAESQFQVFLETAYLLASASITWLTSSISAARSTGRPLAKRR